MMTGGVRDRHALLPVTFRLPGQPDLMVEFVVDTGFTGELSLPSAAVAALQLPFLHRMPADLADDTTIDLAVHSGSIVWQGAERELRVVATGRRPLLGTSLLDGCELVAQFVDAGLVTIDTV